MSRASFIYLWEHPDGRYYFGKRKGHPNDGYTTSHFQLKTEIKTDCQWKRTVLLLTDNETDAYKYEGKLIRKHKHNPLCMNQK
jgi:hypothetical protein